LTYETSELSNFLLVRAWLKKILPMKTDGQLRTVMQVTTGGGFRVEASNDGTLSMSASVKPVASKISLTTSSISFVFAVVYTNESLYRNFNEGLMGWQDVTHEGQLHRGQQTSHVYHLHTMYHRTSTWDLLLLLQFVVSWQVYQCCQLIQER